MKYSISETFTLDLNNEESIHLVQSFNPTNYKNFESEEEALNWGIQFLKDNYYYNIFNVDFEMYNEDDEKIDGFKSGDLVTMKLIETTNKLNGTYPIKIRNNTTDEIKTLNFKFIDGIASKRTIIDSFGNAEILLNNVFTIGTQTYVSLYKEGKYSFVIEENKYSVAK